jgi:hypothetical protein
MRISLGRMMVDSVRRGASFVGAVADRAAAIIDRSYNRLQP